MHTASLHLLIRYFLSLQFDHVSVHLYFAFEGPYLKKKFDL